MVDLGHQPPSNSFLTEKQLDEPEITYPLKVYVCEKCWLVQIPEVKKAVDIFNEDYPYFSSQSPANVSHAKEYTDMMIKRFDPKRVLEIGSNDGYMLQWFKKNGCTVLGVDPSVKCAEIAKKKGIPTKPTFFTSKLAKGDVVKITDWGSSTFSGYASYGVEKINIGQFDLVCSLNTIAHQPDINDFVAGIKIVLAPDGVTTHEFPHLMKLIEECQFDTIYHEHYNYYSFATICTIFQKHGLEVFDVDEIPEHGGSLRIYARHEVSGEIPSEKVAKLLKKEQQAGMFDISYYTGFQIDAFDIKYGLMKFLYNLPPDKLVVAYGAAAKGNTFLNYCKIDRNDNIPFVVDKSPHKQGKYLPGSHLKVESEKEMKLIEPDYVLITAWNLRDEIMKQLEYIREWGGQFIIAIPKLEIL